MKKQKFIIRTPLGKTEINGYPLTIVKFSDYEFFVYDKEHYGWVVSEKSTGFLITHHGYNTKKESIKSATEKLETVTMRKFKQAIKKANKQFQIN